MNRDILWHEHSVSREDREKLNGHQGCVVWFTGLSGCGKSTIANAVDQTLFHRGVHAMLLDGDNVRHGISAAAEFLAPQFGAEFAHRFGLGFAAEDRTENIRRIGGVAQLFCSAGVIVLTALVSPYRRDRDAVRTFVETHGRPGDFVEVFVDTPLEICEQRDPKGLYQKARSGQIKNFTGIDDPYERPESPELVLSGAAEAPDVLANRVVQFLVATAKIQ